MRSIAAHSHNVKDNKCNIMNNIHTECVHCRCDSFRVVQNQNQKVNPSSSKKKIYKKEERQDFGFEFCAGDSERDRHKVSHTQKLKL